MVNKWAMIVAALSLVLAAGVAQAGINIQTVAVGDAGNAADSTGFGAVGYSYNIGMYEVTAGQYTAFLNAVAATDTYGLYNSDMYSSAYGCKIQRNGSSGSYSYSVATDYANRPVNYVSFWDACRFSNWLNNGQGGAGTTEYGAYTLTSDGMANNTITRNAGAQWAVTSEDEWYKAAYYKGGSTAAGYWLYPTRSNNVMTIMANYGSSVDHTTDGGSYAVPSPYGTYDQGGNLWEWNESYYGWYRDQRGGAFNSAIYQLSASHRFNGRPTSEDCYIGFRVFAVPEPGTTALLALGGLGLLARRRAARR